MNRIASLSVKLMSILLISGCQSSLRFAGRIQGPVRVKGTGSNCEGCKLACEAHPLLVAHDFLTLALDN